MTVIKTSNMKFFKRLITAIKSKLFDNKNNFCEHSLWGYVEPDGFQYCIHCNSAKRPDLSSCSKHKYEVQKVEIINILNPVTKTKEIYFYVFCPNCGDIKTLPETKRKVGNKI